VASAYICRMAMLLIVRNLQLNSVTKECANSAAINWDKKGLNVFVANTIGIIYLSLPSLFTL